MRNTTESETNSTSDTAPHHGLPAGVSLLLVTDPGAVSLVHRYAAEAIIGYDASAAAAADRARARRIDALFADDAATPAPAASIIVAAVSESEGGLLGAAVVEAFAPAEMIRKDPAHARIMARTHYVLAGMFVHPTQRGQGIGAALVDEASLQVIRHQGRYLDGFVDARNESVAFYHRTEAVVMERNQGLPARRPTNTPLGHPGGYDGNWFYVDALQRHHQFIHCSQCQQPLVFHPEDGGWMDCPRCLPGR